MHHILFTNNTLSLLAGSELYVYEMALEFRKMGHQVTCFTLRPGEISDRLQALDIRVTSDLSTVSDVSIIQGHHRLEARIAAAYFPTTPVVFASLGPVHPFERPTGGEATFTRYIAVSELVHQALLEKDGIPQAKIDVIPNFVDTDRFKAARPVSENPRRVLILTNYFKAAGIIRQDCEAAGHLEVKEIGLQSASVWDVENYIEWADIVITRGRGAFQALAMGRPVLTFRPEHADGMVTLENFEDMVTNNFSSRIRWLKNDPSLTAVEPTVEQLVTEIKKYNPAETRQLMYKIRERYSLHGVAAKLLEVYETTRREFEEQWGNDPQGRVRAVSRELGKYLAFLKEGDAHLEGLPQLMNDVKTLGTELQLAGQYAHSLEHERHSSEKYARALEEERRRLEEYARALEQERHSSKEYARTFEHEWHSLEKYARALEHERHKLKEYSEVLTGYARKLESELHALYSHSQELENELAARNKANAELEKKQKTSPPKFTGKISRFYRGLFGKTI